RVLAVLEPQVRLRDRGRFRCIGLDTAELRDEAAAEIEFRHEIRVLVLLAAAADTALPGPRIAGPGAGRNQPAFERSEPGRSALLAIFAVDLLQGAIQPVGDAAALGGVEHAVRFDDDLV